MFACRNFHTIAYSNSKRSAALNLDIWRNILNKEWGIESIIRHMITTALTPEALRGGGQIDPPPRFFWL